MAFVGLRPQSNVMFTSGGEYDVGRRGLAGLWKKGLQNNTPKGSYHVTRRSDGCHRHLKIRLRRHAIIAREEVKSGSSRERVLYLFESPLVVEDRKRYATLCRDDDID